MEQFWYVIRLQRYWITTKPGTEELWGVLIDYFLTFNLALAWFLSIIGYTRYSIILKPRGLRTTIRDHLIQSLSEHYFGAGYVLIHCRVPKIIYYHKIRNRGAMGRNHFNSTVLRALIWPWNYFDLLMGSSDTGLSQNQRPGTWVGAAFVWLFWDLYFGVETILIHYWVPEISACYKMGNCRNCM